MTTGHLPFMVTKVGIPPLRSTLIRRPRLTQRLIDGLQAGSTLALVAAPAGFGKTTLLREWIPHNECCVTWVSLDSDDNDPSRFWTYFVAALQQLHADLGTDTLSLLRAHQPRSKVEKAVTATLVNEVALFSDTFVLVLDDYHVIQTPAIHDGLSFFLEHMPHNMHLVIATRTDPPLPLARLRARGHLLEIRADDLRFTQAEAGEFLAAFANKPLTAEEVARLEARTEGWAAGLQLAAVSLQNVSDVAGFITAFAGSHRHVFDYLIAEVLAHQPAAVQEFLLQTAILTRLSGSLCDAVTGGTDSSGMLAYLEQANLFLVPLDEERHWYRYHHLFADVLRARLKQQMQPAQQADLHRRAADWCEANGLVAEAVSHAVAANDTTRVTRLVSVHATEMLGRGEVETIQGWLGALPEQTLRTTPALCIVQAWALLLTRHLKTIEQFLVAAEMALADEHDAGGEALRGEILTIRAFVAVEEGCLSKAVDLAQRATALVPGTARVARSRSTLALSHALFVMGTTTPAIAAKREAAALFRATGDPLGYLFATGDLVTLLGVQGRLRLATEELQQAFNVVRRRGWQHMPPAAVLHVRFANILREQNQLEAAKAHLETAIPLARLGAPIVAARAYAFLAHVRQNCGDTGGATAALQQIQTIVDEWETGYERSFFAAHRARLHLLKGDVSAATDWAAIVAPWDPGESPTYFHEYELVTLARVWLARLNIHCNGATPADPVPLLEWLRARAEPDGRQGIVIETLVLEALARARRDDRTSAVQLLERALTLAEPEGYVRIFVDEGPPMAELLAAVTEPALQLYVRRLLSVFRHESATIHHPGTFVSSVDSASHQKRRRPAPRGEELSDRELEILDLVAAGLTNKEIAQHLHLTVGTVKWHLNRIFAKLGARHRAEAVACARAYGMLRP